MGAAKQDYSLSDLGMKHGEVVAFYDYADELAGTIDSQFIKNPDAQAELVEPLISEVIEAADILSQEFVFVADHKHNRNVPKFRISRVEGALRRIYSALSDYRQRAGTSTRRTKDAIVNIADPIVEKLQRQVERVVTIFLEFVHLSLDRFLQKPELDMLKQRQTNITFLMHRWAVSQQGQ